MKKKDLLKQAIDYGIYAIVLYFVFNVANYCMGMEMTCTGYDSTYWRQNNITLVICDCDCNPNISKPNISFYDWPQPDSEFPYVYSLEWNPYWVPNAKFKEVKEVMVGMVKWREDYG